MGYSTTVSRRPEELGKFGILANRFRCFLSVMQQYRDTVQAIALACVCLHNIMIVRYPGIQNTLFDQEDEKHNRRSLKRVITWTMCRKPGVATSAPWKQSSRGCTSKMSGQCHDSIGWYKLISFRTVELYWIFTDHVLLNILDC